MPATMANCEGWTESPRDADPATLTIDFYGELLESKKSAQTDQVSDGRAPSHPSVVDNGSSEVDNESKRDPLDLLRPDVLEFWPTMRAGGVDSEDPEDEKPDHGGHENPVDAQELLEKGAS